MNDNSTPPAAAIIVTQKEIYELVQFASQRRDITKLWIERFRGFDVSVEYEGFKAPKVTPDLSIVDDGAPERPQRELDASAAKRASRKQKDRELRALDAQCLEQKTGHATFSLAVARKVDITAAIVYRVLQAEQSENLGNSGLYRRYRYWSRISAQTLHEGYMPFLKSRQVVADAIHRLKKAGLLITETTGVFVEAHLRTGRKRDIQTWCHVPKPIDHDEPSVKFTVVTARLYGVREAILIECVHHLLNTAGKNIEVDGKRYVRVSASEIEKLVPITAKSIRALREELVTKGVLEACPNNPGYFKISNPESFSGMTEAAVTEFKAWKRWYYSTGIGRNIDLFALMPKRKKGKPLVNLDSMKERDSFPSI